MTFDEFTSGIKKLCEVYSDRHYPEGRKAILFRKLRGFSAEAFAKAVDDLIADSATAPMLTKIVEAVYSASRGDAGHEGLGVRHTSSTPKCKGCGDSGMVQAIRVKDKASFAFRCKCSAAFGRLPKIPVWTDERFKSGQFIPMVLDDGAFAARLNTDAKSIDVPFGTPTNVIEFLSDRSKF